MGSPDIVEVILEGTSTIVEVEVPGIQGPPGIIGNIADQTLVGNISGSIATPVGLTPTQAKTLLAVAPSDLTGLGAGVSAALAVAIGVTGGMVVKGGDIGAAIGASLSLDAGSLASPSLRLGDAATGFYKPATNQIGVSINGVDTFRFANGSVVYCFQDFVTYGKLQFGTQNATTPMLKKTGTSLGVRLSDDSADAPITAGAVTASGLIKTGATGFDGKVELGRNSDGATVGNIGIAGGSLDINTGSRNAAHIYINSSFAGGGSNGHVILNNVVGTGNVLIGSATDNGAKLQVTGDAKLSGSLYTNNIYPYSGQLVTINTGTGYSLRWDNNGLYSNGFAQPLGTASNPWGAVTANSFLPASTNSYFNTNLGVAGTTQVSSGSQIGWSTTAGNPAGSTAASFTQSGGVVSVNTGTAGNALGSIAAAGATFSATVQSLSSNGWSINSNGGITGRLFSAQQSDGTPKIFIDPSAGNVHVAMSSDIVQKWYTTTTGFATVGTTLSQQSAGTLQVGTTAANALGSLACANVTASGDINLPNTHYSTAATKQTVGASDYWGAARFKASRSVAFDTAGHPDTAQVWAYSGFRVSYHAGGFVEASAPLVLNNVGNLTVPGTGTHTFGTTNTVAMTAGNLTASGPVNTGTLLLMGDTSIRSFGIRAYGDSGTNRYTAIGLNTVEAGGVYDSAKQGGGISLDDRTGIYPVRLMYKPTGTSSTSSAMGIDTSGNAIFSGNITSSGNVHTFGTSTGTNYVAVNGGNSGTGAGAGFFVFNGGTTIGGIGNSSFWTGGAYADLFCIKSGNYVTNAPMAFMVGVTERMRLSTGGKLLIGTASDDGVNLLQVSGGGLFTGTVTSNFQSLSADPTTLDLSTGQTRTIKNTTSGSTKIWINDGGVLKASPAFA
jgi:hypothetical protein